MALKKLKKLYGTNTASNSKNSLSRQASNLKTRLEASGVSTDSRNALQKALNLREGSGFLEGLGDVLERASGLASIKAMITNKNDNLSALEKAWKGFTGDLRYTGTDVLETLNPEFREANGVTKFLSSMAVDILLDPATYLTAGASALAKNATKAGVKALGSADDVAKILKTTKTADQAADIIKGTKAIKGVKRATRADDLLRAGKLYRTADTLDTVANPLKLVPIGAKKAGSLAMKGIEKVSPTTARSLKKIGEEFNKTFNYGNFLKKALGDDLYKKIKVQDGVAQATEAAADASITEQAKLLQQAAKNIKKDPDRVWTTISKVDGSKGSFSFAGMTDDEIMKKLVEFSQNQVYFQRPTVLDASSIQNLVKNKGKLMLPVQDFKNADDLESFTKVLKGLVDDPDKVRIQRYVQKGTEKATGYVIDIGVNNAKTLGKTLGGISDDILKQTDVVTQKSAKYKEQTDLVDALNKTIKRNQKKLSKQDDIIEDLTKQLSKKRIKKDVRTSLEKDLQKAITKRGKINKEIGRTTGNLNRKLAGKSYNKAKIGVETALDTLEALKTKQASIDDLLRTRELIPYEKPIIDMPEMKKIAELQSQFKDTNLGYRALTGTDVSDVDKYAAYVPKVLTPEGRAYLSTPSVKGDPFKRLITQATDKLPSQAAMTDIYGGFSPTEVNTMLGFDLFDNNMLSSNYSLVKNMNRRSYNTQLMKGLFTEDNDWVTNVTKATAETKQQLFEQGFEYVNSKEVIKKLGLSELLTSSDMAEIRKAMGKGKFMIHKDAIELFDRATKMYKQVDSEFYTQLNKFMKNWKGGNLLTVGYHLRNIVGAETNMMLAGMSAIDVSRYSAQAGLDIHKYNSKLLPEFNKWILDPDNAAVFKSGNIDEVTKRFAKQVGNKDAQLFTDMLDAQIKGVWGGATGQHDAVKRAIGEMPKSKVGQATNKVIDLNYKLGATADDVHRLASYRWAQKSDNLSKIAKVGASNAQDFVNYAMFDFKNMSPTEQVYFTKLFPFYNFIKNNMVFQFTNMSKNAQRYNTLSKAYKNLYAAQEITDDEIQQYVKDQLYIPIKQADGSIKVLKIAPPVQDATNLLSLKNILGASNPLLQYITDRAYGQDLYTGAELGDRTRNTQELIDLIPYGRTVRTTLENPLSILLPVSSTTSEKGRNQNAYAELERLEKLRKEYKKKTGQSLPTLEELGLK